MLCAGFTTWSSLLKQTLGVFGILIQTGLLCCGMLRLYVQYIHDQSTGIVGEGSVCSKLRAEDGRVAINLPLNVQM